MSLFYLKTTASDSTPAVCSCILKQLDQGCNYWDKPEGSTHFHSIKYVSVLLFLKHKTPIICRGFMILIEYYTFLKNDGITSEFNYCRWQYQFYLLSDRIRHRWYCKSLKEKYSGFNVLPQKRQLVIELTWSTYFW